jgi:hypothetical protein
MCKQYTRAPEKRYTMIAAAETGSSSSAAYALTQMSLSKALVLIRYETSAKAKSAQQQ